MCCIGRIPAEKEACGVIDVAMIDQWAASGSGMLHRASPISKIVFLLLVISAAVIAKNPYSLMVGYVMLIAVAASTGLPWSRVMVLSWYAAVFALLFSLSIHGGVWIRALFVVKAITPSCAMLMLIISTPYPKIFALLSAALPEVLAAGLFMTYRTLFIKLDMMDKFGAAIRLRGGFSPGSLYKNSANISKGIAMLLVRAVERASRIYAVMVVRGYSGSMAEKNPIRLQRVDWLPVATGCVVLLLVVAW
jgi:energy-coupling factor transporter transmembrane protein EcfT